MLKILINCPGGWSHGLDSPERGEGRWAQNIARMLAKSGRYSVFACSGGIPTWGRGEVVQNIVLLSEDEARRLGPYDLYFDAAWYDNKHPAAEATHNFHVHFGYEPRLGVLFPPGHYLVYVLASSGPSYFQNECGNANRTFYLPAPFGDQMVLPDPARRSVLSAMRGPDVSRRSARFDALYAAVTALRQTQEVPFTWIASPEGRHSQDRVLPVEAAWGIPYREIRSILRGAGLNAALDGWSCMLDATALGVPSLAWEGGIDRTVCDVASRYGLVLKNETDISSVMDCLFGDAVIYTNYTLDLQRVYADHIEARALALFDDVVAKVVS